MEILTAFAIIGLSAVIHASFQLSISVLTLLSGHALGKSKSHAKLLRLSTGYIFGAGVMTMLLISTLALIFTNTLNDSLMPLAWVITCGLLLGVGIAVWLFYYEKRAGTSIWVPRDVATHLSERTKATKRSAEAFGLGLTSVIGELLFIIAPLTVSALALIYLPLGWQLLGIFTYTIVSLLPLLIVMATLGGGRKISHIQKWRERNKRFLQFAAGSGLIVLAGFIYAYQVLALLPGVPS